MGKTPVNSPLGGLTLPRWLVKLCRWVWLSISIFLFIIIPALVLNVLVSSPTKLNDTILGLFIQQHPILIIFLCILLILITVLARIVSRYPVSYSEADVKQLYFKYINQYVGQITNRNNPDMFATSNIEFDKTFVDLRFWPDKILREEVHSSSKTLLIKFIPQKLLNSRLPATVNHIHSFPGKSINFTNLWQGMTSDNPASVILGAPGSGKTTLLCHIALNMIHQGLGQTNTQWTEDIETSLIPIYVKLRDYADEWAKYTDAELSLSNYLKRTADKWYIPNLAPFFEKSLVAGHCLLMLDGLDEVYDLKMRGRVEGAISTFIEERCVIPTQKRTFNRLLITSRITGYNLSAFPHYRHYTIAELSNENIQDFVQKWLKVNDIHKYALANRKIDERPQTTIEQKTKDIIYFLERERGLKSLTRNPLLLTILVKMVWEGSILPRRRVDLYQFIVQAFSEKNQITNRAEPLYQLEALAFWMQENERTLLSRSEIEKVLKLEFFGRESKTSEFEEKSIKSSLQEIQERTGIFIEQGTDSFGFLHRIIQEYMVACYFINKIENDDSWLAKIIGKVRHGNTLWRDPFLLAVTRQSKENVRIARRMIETLIDLPRDSNLQGQLQDLVLAVECLIEAEPLAIGQAIEYRIAEELLRTYIQSKHQQHDEEASQLEDVMRLWLNNLPEGKYRPALLIVLYRALKDELQADRRELTLFLLTKAGWTEDHLQIAIDEDEITFSEQHNE